MLHLSDMLDLPNWTFAAVTLVILVATIFSLIRERLPADMTALFALIALIVTGVLTPAEAFSGFSHPATLTVAAVLVLSAGLERTGALSVLARGLIVSFGGNEFLLTLVLMIVVGIVSAFINNTAAVAVFIPVVMEVCRRGGASPGRVLMPMAHAATLGGMSTLIGTSTNLAAHEYAKSQGLAGFGMFELGKVGIPLFLVGGAYILFVGRWFLPRTSPAFPELGGRGKAFLSALIVTPGSPWIGRLVRPERFRRDSNLEIVDYFRDGKSLFGGESPARFLAGDRIRVRGPLDELLAVSARGGLEIHRPAAESEGSRAQEGVGSASASPAAELLEDSLPQQEGHFPLAEVVVLPGSDLVGMTLRSSRFAERYGAYVLALHRAGAELSERPENTRIHAGDVLVVEGSGIALRKFDESPDFLMISSPARPEPRRRKLWVVLLTMAAVVGSAAMGWIPIVTAATAGCALLIVAGCLEPREAYRAIDLSIVFLLAGALALGTAIEKTGLAEGLGTLLAQLTHVTGPKALLVGFFFVSVILSELMSNSGTVLLLGPVAVASAEHLGVNPLSLIAAVTFGASAAFAMPIGYQTSLMIYGPGGYRVRDFVRMGIPLDLILAAIALTLIPRFWPLTPP